MVHSKAQITAIGTYVPEKVLTNIDLEKIVDTNNEWIVQRTGMRERRIAGEHEYVSDLSCKAIEDMVKRYDIDVSDVDMILVATSTAEYTFPSAAARIQHYFNIPQTGTMDVSAACAGFVYGLQLADSLITSGMYHKVLVVGAETLSKITDYTDRSTCILFGDGAGVVLVESSEDEPGFLGSTSGTLGSGGIHLYKTALGEQMEGQELQKNGYLVQNGREVYKWAVRNVPEKTKELIRESGLTSSDIQWFVPHSANLRMIESICDKGPVPMERTLTSVEYRGNTSAASIPLAIQLALDEGRVKYDDIMLLFGFGGGLTYAGSIIRWGVPNIEK
ncbi:beta-ketoacyl-ACP synthase 3 [Paenibacillus sp. Marseille-Q7038]